MAESLISSTRDALVSFALAGIRDGGHEGMVFWTGRQGVECTVLLGAIVPDARHSAQRVFSSAEEVGRAARQARASGTGILCQVHSHPGDDARHSDGDDDLVLLPFESMLSIVVPRFGVSFRNIANACVHEFQDGRWVLCTAESVASKICTIPSVVDLRA